ncbi:Por secretion system C-terminal sorting domain-containing protein [Dyadobacter koreensis]|uniref:Por secretion system C-terminal sorting domain-containing protein n=1 Tax=Dyadobacter koreensis TaxID=408657 RepID=A0A1H6WM37_9BACT|nr:PQQ-dependent sugar dehydrogenase [Dyadobacter koreensis]SEJ16244.1 Por secretion system C-terminal sorting domain-containing protein [Dyadobacter koreensis]
MKKIDSTSTMVYLTSLLFFCLSFSAIFSKAQPTVKFDPVITGLSSPMQIVHAGDGTDRLFIVQKGGSIEVYDDQYISKGTFLTITDLVSSGEQGLLSMAFHPNYATNGFFFIYYTNTAGDLVVKRFKVSSDMNVADPSSGVVVLTIPHPGQANHNGGEMHFGLDGYLYISTGDGGGGDDPNNNAQNTNVLLGKILRINVNTSLTAPYYSNPADNPFNGTDGEKNEVFAVGLRNPFRWSFDRQTNDMWIGDVGQGAEEEINRRTALTTLGANYGWRCYEGNGAHITGGCADESQFHFPIHTYPTGSAAGQSVVGGIVYRGVQSPLLRGYYIGTDFYSGDLHIIGPFNDPEDVATTSVLSSTYTSISDFGESENGEMFAVQLSTGTIYALSDSEPLPVTLMNFTGTQSYEAVRLTWETTLETDFRQFDIEYSSNAKVFNKIGTVESRKNSTGSSYQFSHIITSEGPKYYRLKMVDDDNTFKYSKIISLGQNTEELTANFIRPSFIDNKTLNVLLEEPFHSLELVSTNGSILFKKDISSQTGNFTIPMETTASGMYIVRLQSENKIVNQKILVSQ